MVIVIYHPHWNDAAANDEALTYITSVIDLILVKFGANINIVLCGDFNGLRNNFHDISALTQLIPIVDSPTRGSRILDQIFSNFATNQKPVCLPPVGRSDHCVVFLVAISTISSGDSESYNKEIFGFPNGAFLEFHL